MAPSRLVRRHDSRISRPREANLSMPTLGRNARCPCGSGKRHKACCGEIGSAVADPGWRPGARSVADLMREALALQQSRRFGEAEELYRGALSLAPDLPDALHMLGVVRYERGDYDEAARFILQALDLTAWQYPTYRHNLGLTLAHFHRVQVVDDREGGRRRV